MSTLQQLFQHTLFIPIISLIAGVIILIFPRVLNFIVGLYLLVVGIFGFISYFK